MHAHARVHIRLCIWSCGTESSATIVTHWGISFKKSFAFLWIFGYCFIYSILPRGSCKPLSEIFICSREQNFAYSRTPAAHFWCMMDWVAEISVKHPTLTALYKMRNFLKTQLVYLSIYLACIDRYKEPQRNKAFLVVSHSNLINSTLRCKWYIKRNWNWFFDMKSNYLPDWVFKEYFCSPFTTWDSSLLSLLLGYD